MKCPFCGVQRQRWVEMCWGNPDPRQLTPRSLPVNESVMAAADGSAGPIVVALCCLGQGSDGHGVFQWERSVPETRSHFVRLLLGIDGFPRCSPAGRAEMTVRPTQTSRNQTSSGLGNPVPRALGSGAALSCSLGCPSPRAQVYRALLALPALLLRASGRLATRRGTY